jgi:hypothetical protein
VADFPRVFRDLPQAILIVHRIRTAHLRFVIAKRFRMRESAFTAGVDVTLPVIAWLVLQQLVFGSARAESKDKLLKVPKA